MCGRAEDDAARDECRARADRYRAPQPGAECARADHADQTRAERDREDRADGDLGEVGLGEADASADAPEGVLGERPAQQGRGEDQSGAAVGEPGGLHPHVLRRRTDRETAGQRPYGECGEGEGGEGLAVARAEVRDGQIHRSRERGHAQQAEGGGTVGVPVGGDAGRGDRRGRTRSEAADHRARDDRGDGVREGGRAVAEDGEGEADAGEDARADPVDARGEQKPRCGRTQQQRTADGTGLRGGQRQPGVEAADGGGQEVGGEVPGREKGDEGPGHGGGAGGHGRSQGMRKKRLEKGVGRRPSTDRNARAICIKHVVAGRRAGGVIWSTFCLGWGVPGKRAPTSRCRPANSRC